MQDSINALLRLGRKTEAAQAAMDHAVRNRNDGHAWHFAGRVQLHAGLVDQALICLRTAAQKAPADLGFAIELGRLLSNIGQHVEARRVSLAAAALDPSSARDLDAVGALLTHCGAPETAIPYFRRSLAFDPANRSHLFNLASALTMVGESAEAEERLDTLLQIDPFDGQALRMRSGLRIQTSQRNHVAQLERACDRAGTGLVGVPAYFALGKELEDLGDHPAAFRALSTGCAIQKAAMNYDVGADIAAIDAIIAAHSAQGLAGAEGSGDDAPIFVFGLPRSGTTLVEQILGRHPQAAASGELNAFPGAVTGQIRKMYGADCARTELAWQSLTINPTELAQSYLDFAWPEERPRHFIDKQPMNYLYAGLIHRAFPKARLIGLMRDPHDSCFAMYKSLFSGAYPFSYDLDDLGRYRAAWDRLMVHWQDTLGDALLMVGYEDLVTDQAGVTAQVLAHVNLPWAEACLSPHLGQGPVGTASASQVRAPVHNRSVGLWRNYESELGPLTARLAHESARSDDTLVANR